MAISDLEFEQNLQSLADECRDPVAGLFGPDSLSWSVSGETATLAGAGRALLMQISHPIVANALQFRSGVQDDLAGRLRSTSMGVLNLLFGDLPTVMRGSRILYRVHSSIRGEIEISGPNHPRGMPYCAADPEPLFWVHATLIDSAVRAYELMVRPLKAHELERYYAEARRFGILYGIPVDFMPRSWLGFQGYMQRTIHEDLIVTDWARETARRILETRNTPLRPLLEYQRLFTAHLLPENLREGFDLPYGATQRMAVRTSVPAMRTSYHALPAQLRYWPACLDARRRLRGKGPDKIGHALEEWVLGALPQAS